MSSAEFYAAIRLGDTDEVRRLMAADGELAAGCQPGHPSPALVALYSGHRSLADELAAQVPSLSVFEAAAFDDNARLSHLIETDPALIGAWNSEGWQPIHLTAMFGRADAARTLLDADALAAQPAQNAGAAQPLHLAAQGGHCELVWILIASHSPVEATDSAGRTPLMLAAAADDEESVRALLRAGADPVVADRSGRRAWDYAVGATIRTMVG